MGMMMFRSIGLTSLIYAAVLFTISFFVLLVVRKLEKDGFRYFGLAVVGMLWLSAVLSLSIGIQSLSSQCPMMRGAKMHNPAMTQGNMPGMMKGRQTPAK